MTSNNDRCYNKWTGAIDKVLAKMSQVFKSKKALSFTTSSGSTQTLFMTLPDDIPTSLTSAISGKPLDFGWKGQDKLDSSSGSSLDFSWYKPQKHISQTQDGYAESCSIYDINIIPLLMRECRDSGIKPSCYEIKPAKFNLRAKLSSGFTKVHRQLEEEVLIFIRNSVRVKAFYPALRDHILQRGFDMDKADRVFSEYEFDMRDCSEDLKALLEVTSRIGDLGWDNEKMERFQILLNEGIQDHNWLKGCLQEVSDVYDKIDMGFTNLNGFAQEVMDHILHSKKIDKLFETIFKEYDHRLLQRYSEPLYYRFVLATSRFTDTQDAQKFRRIGTILEEYNNKSSIFNDRYEKVLKGVDENKQMIAQIQNDMNIGKLSNSFSRHKKGNC